VRTATTATDGRLAIGEVARRSGFTVKALRFYERLGLLPPSGRRPSGYRLYSEADLHRLEFIRQAKALGLTLEAIRELVVAAREPGGVGARPRLLRMLEERIAQTAQQIAMLTRLRQELERRRRALAHGPYLERSNGYCPCLERTVAPRASLGKAACRRARPSRRPAP
jgi:DNA-binding transcriptional MerR regulator